MIHAISFPTLYHQCRFIFAPQEGGTTENSDSLLVYQGQIENKMTVSLGSVGGSAYKAVAKNIRRAKGQKQQA